jgi:translation initiation factor 1 (eIF-1/SUI1)
MKNITRSLLIACIGLSALQFNACKSDKKEKSTADTIAADTVTTAAQTPIEISPDQELNTKINDATKDFPGVTATVSDGEINLTGEIKRDRLPQLMQSLSGLQAKKSTII